MTVFVGVGGCARPPSRATKVIFQTQAGSEGRGNTHTHVNTHTSIHFSFYSP